MANVSPQDAYHLSNGKITLAYSGIEALPILLRFRQADWLEKAKSSHAISVCEVLLTRKEMEDLVELWRLKDEY